MIRTRIISTGYYLPSKVLTNKELESMVDTTDEWITTRTGIKERRIAEFDEASSDMGTKAAQMAIKNAGIDPASIDLVICATITPDHAFPSTACLIQNKLNINNTSFAFDISAACSGFIYALNIADSLLQKDSASTALVVATEKMSSITNWKDRATCVLFGDGAGAAILCKEEGDRGILSSFIGSDGSYGDLLIVPAGGSKYPINENRLLKGEQFLQMKGNEVFKVAVQKMSQSAIESLKIAGLSNSDIKLFIPHQANLRIINAVKKRLKLSDNQVYINIEKVGNMSAATIALGLAEAQEKGLIKEGDIIGLVAFGAGFTWASMVLRW